MRCAGECCSPLLQTLVGFLKHADVEPSVWSRTEAPGCCTRKAFWDGLGDCYEQGLVKAVGVSNYGTQVATSHAGQLGDPHLLFFDHSSI